MLIFVCVQLFLFQRLFDAGAQVERSFLRRICNAFSEAFFMFAGGLCCWRLQLNLSDDFSKTVQRTPFKKTNLSTAQKRSCCCCCCNPLPALVATINPAKLPQSRKTAKPHSINVNTVKNHTQPTQNQKNPTQKSLHPPSKYTHIFVLIKAICSDGILCQILYHSSSQIRSRQ